MVTFNPLNSNFSGGRKTYTSIQESTSDTDFSTQKDSSKIETSKTDDQLILCDRTEKYDAFVFL